VEAGGTTELQAASATLQEIREAKDVLVVFSPKKTTVTIFMRLK
jgi:hypothetical protein